MYIEINFTSIQIERISNIAKLLHLSRLSPSGLKTCFTRSSLTSIWVGKYLLILWTPFNVYTLKKKAHKPSGVCLEIQQGKLLHTISWLGCSLGLEVLWPYVQLQGDTRRAGGAEHLLRHSGPLSHPGPRCHVPLTSKRGPRRLS